MTSRYTVGSLLVIAMALTACGDTTERTAGLTNPRPTYIQQGDWQIWNVGPERAAQIREKVPVQGTKVGEECRFPRNVFGQQPKGTRSVIGEINFRTCEGVVWHTTWTRVIDPNATVQRDSGTVYAPRPTYRRDQTPVIGGPRSSITPTSSSATVAAMDPNDWDWNYATSTSSLSSFYTSLFVSAWTCVSRSCTGGNPQQVPYGVPVGEVEDDYLVAMYTPGGGYGSSPQGVTTLWGSPGPPDTVFVCYVGVYPAETLVYMAQF